MYFQIGLNSLDQAYEVSAGAEVPTDALCFDRSNVNPSPYHVSSESSPDIFIVRNQNLGLCTPRPQVKPIHRWQSHWSFP